MTNLQLLLGADSVAYNNLLLLDAVLRDTATISLRRNTSAWFFHTGPGVTIDLYTMAGKLHYAHHRMALTAYILGRREEAREHVLQAPSLDPRETGRVRALMLWDVEKLAAARPELAPELRVFRARFLGW